MSRGKKLEVQLFGGTIGHLPPPWGAPRNEDSTVNKIVLIKIEKFKNKEK